MDQLTSEVATQLASQLTSELTTLTSQLTSLSTSLFDNLSNMADSLYKSYFEEPPAVKPARASRRDEEPIDENFTAILADSDVLKVLQMTTKKVFIDVDQYEANLCSMINELTKTHTDHFDVILEVICRKVCQQIDWAKMSVQFEPLKNDDRVLLLKNSWSSNLLLDSLYQRIHKLPDQMTLDSGEKFNLLTLALFGNDDLLAEHELEDLQAKLVKLKFDYVDYVCTKFLLLLDLDLTRLDETAELKQRRQVRESYEQILTVFGDYTTENYCLVPDKFDRLLSEIIPEIKSMALKKLEKHLVQRYTYGHSIPPVILELLDGKTNLDRITRVRRPF